MNKKNNSSTQIHITNHSNDPSKNRSYNFNLHSSYYQGNRINNINNNSQNVEINKKTAINLRNSSQKMNKYKKRELEKQEELEKQKMKKENEIENNIRDMLKCYICLSKVTKPRMCNYCKRICCEACIQKWFESHNACGICKHTQTLQDMIALPFLDDMSAYFINNIDNQPKRSTMMFNNRSAINSMNPRTYFNKSNKYPKDRININNNNNNINNNIININNNNAIGNIDYNNENALSEIKEDTECKDNSEIMETEEENNICTEHGNKIDFYCIQCNKYFCSQCLIFFGEESKKHSNHYIVKVDTINDLGVNEAINEYNKLPQTKSKIEDLIGLCNLKLRENEIKKYETIKSLNKIKDLYIKKINEDSNTIKNLLKDVKITKNKILTEMDLFPSKYMKIEKNNNINEAQDMMKEIKTLNKVDQILQRQIHLENINISRKLYVDNFQTEFMDFNIHRLRDGAEVEPGQQFQNNQQLVNCNLNIANYPCRIMIKYAQNKVFISFSIKINEPFNSPNYPTFQSYIIFKNNKFGLEFIHLTNQFLAQNLDGQFAMGQSREQVNSLELDADRFLFLINEENKISLKIFVTKSYYK